MSWPKRIIEGPSDEERLRDELVRRAAAIPPDEWKPKPYDFREGWFPDWYTATTPGGVVLELRPEVESHGDWPSSCNYKLWVNGDLTAHVSDDRGHPLARAFGRVHSHWAPRIKAAEAARSAEAAAAEAARKRRLLDNW